MSIRAISLTFVAVFAALCALLFGYALDQYLRTERASRAIVASVDTQARLYSTVLEISRERSLTQLAMAIAGQGPLRGLSTAEFEPAAPSPPRISDVAAMLRRRVGNFA